ncbi:LamG domain-containing protein, partial [bacterium]|nr:LamG domain-containing protein [bacterium]
PDTLPFLDITGGERTDDGLLVLYTFNEGDGLTVFDSSGVGDPMNLTIEDPNNAEWGDGFLETTGVNQIATEGPASKIITGCMDTDELTVEGWIKTSDITQNGPARIITCSIDSVDRNFTFGQGRYSAGGDRIEMRYRTDANPNNAKQVTEVNTARGTLTEALTHVVLVRDSSGGVFAYINNESLQILLSGSTPVTEVEGGFSTWDDTYKFGVGNEISAQRAWLGEFHLVAVYNKALSVDEVSQNYNAGPFIGDDSSVSNWAIYLD